MNCATFFSTSLIVAIALIPVSLCVAQEEAKEPKLSPRIGKRFLHPDKNMIVSSIKISADGKTIIGSDYPKNNIQVWDLESGNARLWIDSPDEYKGAIDFWFPSADFSQLYLWVEGDQISTPFEQDGKLGKVVAYPDSEIQVWNLTTGTKELLEKPAPNNQVCRLTNSPDHKYILCQELSAGTVFGNQKITTRFMKISSSEWTDLGTERSILIKFNRDGTRTATFELDESQRFITRISVKSFPEHQETLNIKLPEGLHGFGNIQFCDNGKYLVAEYRTYQAEDDRSNWKTTIACFDLETGEQAGKYDYPYANDSPIFADENLASDTLVFTTWRHDPKVCYGLSLPTLKQKWNTELGDYRMATRSIVSNDKNWLAIVCVPDSPWFAADGNLKDWTGVPESELKIISSDGNLLENVPMPPGTQWITQGEDGTVAVGSRGAVYLLDLDSPFENEPSDK